jgi:hypothetical protein
MDEPGLTSLEALEHVVSARCPNRGADDSEHGWSDALVRLFEVQVDSKIGNIIRAQLRNWSWHLKSADDPIFNVFRQSSLAVWIPTVSVRIEDTVVKSTFGIENCRRTPRQRMPAMSAALVTHDEKLAHDRFLRANAYPKKNPRMIRVAESQSR